MECAELNEKIVSNVSCTAQTADADQFVTFYATFTSDLEVNNLIVSKQS